MKCLDPFISKHLEHPTARQLLFSIIGPRLTAKYYGGHPDEPHLLIPPYLSETDRTKCLHDLQNEMIDCIVRRIEKDGGVENIPQIQAFVHEIGERIENELKGVRARNDGINIEDDAFGVNRPPSKTKTKESSTIASGLTTLLRGTAIAPRNIPPSIHNTLTPNSGEKIAQVFMSLKGRVIPPPLRRYLWAEHLGLDRDFKMLVNNSAKEKGILDPFRTGVRSLISTSMEAAVQDTALRNVGNSRENAESRFIVRVGSAVLNIYYVLTGLNSVEMAYLLLPLLTVFCEEEGILSESCDVGEIAFTILPYFITMAENFSGDENSVEMAAAGQTLLQGFDPELHTHLCNCFASDSGTRSGVRGLEGLMRTFLDISFVSLLPRDALNFVWDHSFLYGWNNIYPATICCDILLLQKRALVSFHGNVHDAIALLRANKAEITTKMLRERFRYFENKALLPDLDFSRLIAGEKPPASKLSSAFKFSDRDFTPEKLEIESETDYKRKLIRGMVDFVIGKCFERLDEKMAATESATKLQAIQRGAIARKNVKDPDFLRKSHEKSAIAKGNMKAAMLLQRLLRGAIARRRVKKAKEERRAMLLKKGLEDDTEEKEFEVEFEAGSLGMKCRGVGEEGLCEVASVNEGGQAEKFTIKAGDRILAINGADFKYFKQLKKRIKEVKGMREGKITIKFERSEKIKLYTTSLV